MRLGLVLSQFPRYDEAFILREVVGLADEQPQLLIFSLRPCHDRVIHAQAKALQPQTVYAPFVLSWAVWQSQWHFLTQKPAAYFGALGWVLNRHWNHPVILLKTLVFFPKIAHFAHLAAEKGVTHLHAFWATYPAAASLIIQQLTGIPFSLSGHAHDIYTVNPTLVEKMRAAKFLVTCTEANKQHLLSLVNGQAEKLCPIAVSYHGVDLQKFSALPKQNGNHCRLLAVGSLFACKGLETLIEACAILRKRSFPVAATLAGGGPLEKKLRRLIAKHGLDSCVTITGYVSQDQVAGFYQQAHLFVLPLISRIHWGIPNVLIEALATKTPVICCDLPSMRELVVHGQSGWIIPEEDSAALADAIEALWKDAGLRLRLGEAGFQRVADRFSLEKTGAALRAIFDEYAFSKS